MTPPSTEAAAQSKAATPLMQQYLRVKSRYVDEIVFFRLGDFYEMFFEDAIKAAPILEVTLTQRQSIPMCGVPHHAATGYIAKLIKAGLSVAMAEQLEDPKSTKGMVKRDVVRVITPGTLVEDELLSAKSNNFLVAVAGLSPRSKKGFGKGEMTWGLAAADVSTGQQWVGEVKDDSYFHLLKSHLTSFNPSEILLVGGELESLTSVYTGKAVLRLEPASTSEKNLASQAQAAIQSYLTRDHAEAVKSLQSPLPLPSHADGIVFLDETAIRHLELVTPSDPVRPGPTLLSVLDKCATPLGSRLLKWRILHPSANKKVLQERLNQVEHFVDHSVLREDLFQILKKVADIERISVRTQAGTASPRDLEALRESLRQMPKLKSLLPMGDSLFVDLTNKLQVPAALLQILETQLSDEPPSKLGDGGVIREGHNAELDDLRHYRRNGKSWIAALEAQERERTGIGSLKIGYNDIFGYFLEVSKTNISKVPPEWIRKQTMANGERYITPELKSQEEKILGAEDKIRALEFHLYADLVRSVAAYGSTLSLMGEGIAHLDVTLSLAQVAVQNNYIKPVINDSTELFILKGRHPVVEKQLGRDKFIANDTTFQKDQKRIAIITGPNMAGKSTFLRQSALIVILAQMGSFVPAERAEIGIVDKIFTRIGASDRLSQGQSTFMVEMEEVANLLRYCTAQSLLVLDEVGRGTSTYDGVSIAWAVLEYLSTLKPRTLFATHYFELTQLEDQLSCVYNLQATAKEWPGSDGRRQVVFLYQIRSGAADRSYGIHVADMAGLPPVCVQRAREILHKLENGTHQFSSPDKKADKEAQLDFFGEHPVLEDIRQIDPNTITPLEALSVLSSLKNQLMEKKIDG